MSRDLKVVAFMPVYNEADILPWVLKHMTEQGIHVHALDGWSIDGSWDILRTAGSMVTCERFPESGPTKEQECTEILSRIEQLAARSDATWCYLSDADEWRRSPRAGETLLEAIKRVDATGYNVIDHKTFDFFCTDDGWTGNPEEYFRYYTVNSPIARLPQEKLWKNLGRRVDLTRSGGHRVEFGGKRVSPEKFTLKHYGYRTPEQARRKVTTRLERRCQAEHAQGWGVHYDQFKPDFSFCWNSRDLMDWRDVEPIAHGKPAFSILHTSARPKQWREVYEAWLNAAVNPESFEYVLVIDPRWGFPAFANGPLKGETLNCTGGDLEAGSSNGTVWGMRRQDKVVMNTGRMCYVDGVNLAAENSTGQILIVNADDQFPCPSWDAQLLKKLDFISWKQKDADFVARVSTGTPNERERNITVMPIVSRGRYERLGYFLYPEYESMSSDNDLSEHAQRDGVLIEIPDLIFPHRHPFFDNTVKMDEAYKRQNRGEAYERGAEILARRRADGFNSRPSLVRTDRAAPKHNLAICLPGEWFHSTWVAQNAMQLMLHLFKRFRNVWPVMPCGISNVHMARQAALDYISKLPETVQYVLWIDDDNLLSGEQLDLLLQDLETHPEISGVVGWCFIFPDGRPSVGAFDEKGGCHSFDYQKMMAADADLLLITGPGKDDKGWSGFPVVLHRYDVIEKIGRFPFRPILNDEWTTGMTGEDTAFFMKASNAGLRFVVDRRVRVPHLKYGNPEPDWMMKDEKVEAAPIAPNENGSEGPTRRRNLLNRWLNRWRSASAARTNRRVIF